ncbi:CCA tRNA nucleotidyltransferase [bacterium]|nr:CCA tRNA nucleotidyltransferase [bacterium]
MNETIFEGQKLAIVRTISKLASAYGYGIYLVGGMVRDILLEKEPVDIDIAVIGDAIQLADAIKEKTFARVIKSEPNLRTIKLDFGNDIEMDFASTRREIYVENKGMPVASFFGCPLKEDVMRRDFSINALAISINSSNYGEVVDFVGGKKDLENKLLRVLHDESFHDDPTRIIRAFKFAHRLGFEIEEHTKALMDKWLDNVDYSETISPMRIKKEFYEIFNMNSVEIMEDFVEKRIYKVLSDKINKVDFQKTKQVIDENDLQDNAAFIYFLSLFLRKDNLNILKHFNLTKSEVKIIQDLKLAGEFDGNLSDAVIYRLYSSRTKASIALEMLLKNNPHVQKYVNNLSHIKIEISGEDLLMMGVPESKSYTVIFEKVLEEKFKGSLPDKSSELRYVRKLLMNNEV